MKRKIGQISLVVRDYDEAIQFYTQKLGFHLLEDTQMSETKRWVVVSPSDESCALLLAKAANDKQLEAIGNQTGGRVFLFLYTDDFWGDYHKMIAQGIRIIREPSEESFGTVCVFEDLYGNLWDFIQPR